MAFNVKISIDESGWTKEMVHAQKQVAFGKALALGMTAGNGKVSGAVGSGGAREDLKEGLRRFMQIRGNKSTGGYMGKSMRSTRAGKRRLWADVGTIDERLADQALGATRRGDKGEQVPSVGRGMPRTSIEKKTPKSRWAGNAMSKDATKPVGARRLFVIDGKNGHKLVMKKVGPMKKRERYGSGRKGGRGNTPRVIRTTMRGKSGDARVMWSIAPDIRIKVIWPFGRLVQRSVIKHWQRNADAAFAFAFRTKR